MLLSKCTIVIALAFSSTTSGFVVELKQHRLCYSDMKTISGFPTNGSYGILVRMFGQGCTHIVGNLILTDLYATDDGNDPDLSFLRTIREITGYLIIMYSNVETIPLSNLEVIHAENGGYRIHESLEPAALLVRNNFKNQRALRKIDLRSLRSIVRGSVYAYDNPGLCHWPSRINWTNLFETPGEQQVLDKDTVETGLESAGHGNSKGHVSRSDNVTSDQCSNADCSTACRPFSDGRTYCWGSFSEDCQIESRCSGLLCERCYRDSDKEYCCHDQCLGGCTGPLASQCKACKEYNDSDTCVPHCPLGNRLNTNTNGQTRYRLTNLCVDTCPTGFLVQNDVCVTHCNGENMHAVGNLCEPCLGQCPRVCQIVYPMSPNKHPMKILGSNNLQSLTNCTYLKGNLIINKESFHSRPSIPDHVPITTIDQLWALHSLHEVSGFVYMDLEYFGTSLRNFSFLENLVKVGGIDPTARYSILIINSGATIPGLRSLRQVTHGRVSFLNNSRLCYIQKLPWLVSTNFSESHWTFQSTVDRSKITGDLHIFSDLNPDQTSCELNGARCHAVCDQEFGCWGPGADQCIRCLNWRAGGHNCVSSCDGQHGYMSDKLSATYLGQLPNSSLLTGSPDTENICVPCHAECGETCSGSGPHECIGRCKTAWADGRCVAQCDHSAYLNGDRRICEPCHNQCHPRPITHQPVCTGPGRHPGHGGCNKCEKIVIQPNHAYAPDDTVGNSSQSSAEKMMCLRGDCPKGTYLTTEIVKPGSVYARVVETFTSMVPICRSCHPLCPNCSAYSVLEAGPSRLGCVVCSGLWFRETCVERCPERDTYSIPSNRTSRPPYNRAGEPDQRDDTATKRDRDVLEVEGGEINQYQRHVFGRCLACHTECHMGCWGPDSSQCNHCLHVRIHLSLVPLALLQNHTEVLVKQKAFTSQEVSRTTKKTDNLFGPFLCLPTCLDGLNFLIKDPASGDMLCYHAPLLSATDHNLLLHEIEPFAHLPHSHPTIGNELAAERSHHSVSILLIWLFILCLGTTACIVFCCCCARRRKRKKRGWNLLFNGTVTFLSPVMNSWQSRMNRSHTNATFSNPAASENDKRCIEGKINTAGPIHDSFIRKYSSTYGGLSGGSMTRTSSKAPNLGRLIMIQSDDLELDERFGPLGTGAFGSVYRGWWRLHDSDWTSLQVTNALNPGCVQVTATAYPSVSSRSGNCDRDEASRQPLLPPRDTVEASNIVLSDASGGARGKMLQVAVKIINEVHGSGDLDALLDEAKVMASVSHRHCLPLLGVCLSQSRKCLVSAYVVNGSLERYLRKHAADLPAPLLLEWAGQIADGMTYLQARGIIHRDLATRNVLVTARDHLQITDFGLAKMLEGEYEENGGEVVVRSGRVPIRWLAIETLTHGRYSFKTDVWAYGVTTWELFTFGQKPYELIETSNVKSHILSGGRLPQPNICSLELYQVMLQCWNEDPKNRPNINTLFSTFKRFAQNPDRYVQSTNANSVTTVDIDSSIGGDTRSRLTIYPSSHFLNDRPESTPFSLNAKLHRQSGSPSNLNGPGEATTARRFDPRRHIRCSIAIPPTQSLSVGRFVKFQQHKRRSTGCRQETNTLSTSLSMTSSGMSDRWSHSAFGHHSHPMLMEAKEMASIPGHNNISLPSNPNNDILTTASFNSGPLNTDSWASSGQPLLSGEHDSSISHLMLSNPGYANSDSHNSMTTPGLSPVTSLQELDNGAPSSEQLVLQTGLTELEDSPEISNVISDLRPINFEPEAAAGYVWPQWPAAYSEEIFPNENFDLTQSSSTANISVDSGEEGLTHLNRQLWLRRSARQRQFYLQQSQLHRSAIGTGLPEQITEEDLEEVSDWRQGIANRQLGNDSDAEDPEDRYCPDPTVKIP